MTVHAYFARYSTATYPEGVVLLLDDEIPQERDLANTGYFQQIKTPEQVDGPAESPDRAR